MPTFCLSCLYNPGGRWFLDGLALSNQLQYLISHSIRNLRVSASRADVGHRPYE